MRPEIIRRRIRAARSLGLTIVERYERINGKFNAVVDVKDAGGEVIFTEAVEQNKLKLATALNERKNALATELAEVNDRLSKIQGV